MSEDTKRSEAELQAEIEELRARNAALERRQAEEGTTERGRGRRWRWPLAVTLLVVGALALALAVPAVWARNFLLDTDRYVETVAPLASSAAVRESLSTNVVDRLFEGGDVESRVRSALPEQARPLAPPLTDRLRSVSEDAAVRLMATEQFRTLWTEANRRSHEAVLPVLLGESGPRGLVDTDKGTVSIDVADIVARVKSRLVDAGVPFVENVPDDVRGGEFVIFQSDGLARVQSWVRALRTLAWVLPVLALLAFAGAVLASPDRRRALLWVGISSLVAMVAIGAGLAFARSYYVGSADRLVLDGAGAGVFFDTLVRFLRNALRTVALLGGLLAAGAALAGPSSAAVAIRRTAVKGAGGASGALGIDLGRFSEWVDRHRRGIEAVVLALLALRLFTASPPTPGLVLGLAAGGLVLLALVELLARAHTGPPPQPTT